MAKGRVGIDPFEGVIPRLGATDEVVSPQETEEEPNRKRRERLTVQIDPEIINHARNAVYWTPGLTLAALTEEAIRQYLERMEAERGEAFQDRKQELKAGRPVL
ncbi:MAG: hypothetical protein V2B18_25225 [Pseudomonadota bacterium]